MRRRREGCFMCSRSLRSLTGFRCLGCAVVCSLILLSAACRHSKTESMAPNWNPPAAIDQVVKPEGVLRVCADPNNLPFSNTHREGFENKIADVLARELGERVEYTWWAQRRGFFRNTLK